MSNKRAENSIEARKKREQIEKAKEIVFAMERDNYDKIIAFASSQGYYKLGGNSALMYYYDIAKKIGRSPTLHIDFDFYSTFRDGIVSIRPIEKFVVDMERNGYKAIEELEDGRIIVFSMPSKMTPEYLERLRKTEENKIKEIHKMVTTNIVWPDVNRELDGLMRVGSNNVRKMETAARECLGFRLLDNILAITKSYYDICNERVDAKEEIPRMLAWITEAKVLIKIFTDQKMWALDACTAAGVMLTKAERLLRVELKKINGNSKKEFVLWKFFQKR